jgi:undecaprenyl-diphosphatase
MSLLTYVAGNVAIMGTVRQRLLFLPTLLTQSASSFVNRVSPANIGGMALNVRYLQKSGVDPPAAVAAVGLNSLAGLIAHVVLIVIFFAWSGSNLEKAFSLPSGSTVLLVAAGLAAAAGIVLATRWGRHQLLGRLVKALRSSRDNLRQVASSPVKLAMLFGGSAAVTLAYIGALVATVHAFGGGVSVAAIGVVYLAASAVAAAAPTPGGLGPLEAALVAGLTGVGLSTGPAVSAVLTYRLATYWLPVLPGWLSWQLLLRRSYV